MYATYEDEWHKGKRRRPRTQILEIKLSRQSGDTSTAWLLIDRQETEEIDQSTGTVREATIRIHYQQLKPRPERNGTVKGDFCGSYLGIFNTVSLTSTTLSSGAVFLDPASLRGNRIGTYLMNEIVKWAKQWPDATVNTIKLRPEQANDANKDRRNRFYEQFGLSFDYTDTQHQAGESRPMPASALNIVETWQQNIQELTLPDFMENIMQAEDEAQYRASCNGQAYQHQLKIRQQAEAHPFRWAMTILWQRNSQRIITLAVLAAVLTMIWVRFR